MNKNFIDEIAVNKSDRTFPVEKTSKNTAVTISMPFSEIKHLLEGYPSPQRPNRVSPIHSEDTMLQDEIDAWEAASDEAFESTESDLLDNQR